METLPSLPPLDQNVQCAKIRFWTRIIEACQNSTGNVRAKRCEEYYRELLRCIFFQQLEESAHRMNHAVSQFLALSNCPEAHGWLGLEHAGHMTAALQYVCRCLAATEIFKHQLPTVECKVIYSYPSTSENTCFNAMNEVKSMDSTAHTAETRVSSPVEWSAKHEA